MSELKPCAFCGGVPEIKTTRGDTSGPGSIIISCAGCGISFDNIAIKKHLWSNPDNASYKSDVIDQWNTRHIPEGYQLVPIEPQKLTIAAIGMTLQRMLNSGETVTFDDAAKAVYEIAITQPFKAAGDQDEN